MNVEAVEVDLLGPEEDLGRLCPASQAAVSCGASSPAAQSVCGLQGSLSARFGRLKMRIKTAARRWQRESVRMTCRRDA